jgi:urease accessory protein
VHAHASAVVDRGGVLRRVVSAPPVTLRQVYCEDGLGLCLVGTAAGPLAGDELCLTLDVEGDTTLVAAGATIAQGGASTLRTSVVVGAGARLRADPGLLVVCAGAHVDIDVHITLDATATIEWRELLVLGRANEPPGTARLTWNVTRDGTPLLRQTTNLADPALTRWPGMLRGKRTLATTLRAGPGVDARTVVHSPTFVTHRLAEHAELTTELTD